MRIPAWAEQPAASLAGVALAAVDGMVRVRRHWRRGDRLELRWTLRTVLVRRDGTTLAPAQVGAQPVEALLLHGPWVMAVEEDRSPLFFSEPWPSNRLELPLRPVVAASTPLQVVGSHLEAVCHHGGFAQPAPVHLHPLAERTCCRPGVAGGGGLLADLDRSDRSLRA